MEKINMNRISRQLIKIANDANQHLQLTLKLNGTSSYMIVPFGKEGMDAEQLVTYILKTEKQLKIGFDQLHEHIESCRYYGIQLHNGQLFAYCSAGVYNIAKAFVENEYYYAMSNHIKLNGIDGDKVKSFVQDLFKECFKNISIKIQDAQIGEIISWAKKILDRRMRQL